MNGPSLLAPLVGVGWVVLVASMAWSRRPRRGRAATLLEPPEPSTADRLGPLDDAVVQRRGRPSMVVPVAASVRSGLELLGRAPRRLLALPRRPAAERRLGSALVVLVAVGFVATPVALPAAVAVWLAPWLLARRRARRLDDLVLDELPDAIDLLRLVLGSGSSMRLAIGEVAPRCGDTIGAALKGVERQLGFGVPLAGALNELSTLGEPFRPVLDAMRVAERHGAPISALLDRLASDARGARRRRAEELARRVPVKLLFPLVFCTLPAFGLLTVVPLLASALGRFSL